MRLTDRIKKMHRGSAIHKKQNKQLLVLTLPMVVKVFIFSYVPMVGLIMAFQQLNVRRGIFGSPFVGLSNFMYLFKSSIVNRLIINSITYNVLFIIFATIVSLILGLFLFEIESRRFVKAGQTIIIFPYFVSWPLVGVLVSGLIGGNGIITRILATFNMPVDIYSRPDLWRFILTFVYVWKVSGFSAVTYYAMLLGADKEVFEAAEIDGAGRFKTMWFISIPYLKIMIIINIIMSCANILRVDFNMIYFVTSNRSTLLSTTDVIETYMFRTLRTDSDFNISTAVGLVQGVAGLILTALMNYLSKKIAKTSLY